MDKLENLRYTHVSLHLLNTALTELEILNQSRTKDELHFVDSLMVKRYRLSLMYMFVMEYCKLLEPTTLKDENFASLARLNLSVSRIESIENYNYNYREIKKRISEIVRDEFSRQVRILRNTKYAHLDGIKDEFKFPALTDVQLTIARKNVNSIIKVHNQCAAPFGTDYIINVDDSTNIIIKNYGRYFSYYEKNLPQSFIDTHL